MSTEALLYWITRLDSIKVVLAICIAACVVGSVVFFAMAGYNNDEGNEATAKRLYKATRKAIAGFFLFMMVFAMVPSTKDALIISGVGGTIDYLKKNETAVQLPDKTIKALNKFFDKYMEDGTDEQN